ncbi:DNA-binding response regulator [Cellvibrio zantedeschiae]|uniref:DNA-binding response regulator n=1 Tax=Cellvibrio zantedeschiae TaxID=1237077 RepID=A0ABQ3AVW3_9GAMM|nr:LytTR family DNA-binding domain-containing protein [Cellvibrio zantedeschiae]GGY65782.1 DNA-binding response regulator [Cellvibrio zantedeschiae]
MKALIVEDSRLARTELKDLLQAHPNIELCGEAESPRDARPIIEAERPDLLFLDINMPGENGFELLEALDYDPKIIFITAYADYALRSFEFSTVDYLLKPISAARLKTAIDKLGTGIEETPTPKEELLEFTSRVLLREGENCHWVQLGEIIYFESNGNYTYVFWGESKALVYRTLGKLEERLPEKQFFRANRQQIINIEYIAKVDLWLNGSYKVTLKTGLEIEISRRHTARFKGFFSL